MIETNTIPNVISGHNIHPVLPTVPCNVVYHEDCMEGLKRFPDNYFDLAVVDPPYGIDINNQTQGKGGGVAKKIDYAKKDWDKEPPNKAYFNELMRVSKNQIIFGANHFISKIPFDSSCWIVWDKDNGETDFADCELAWTSFKTAVRRFKFTWAGMRQQNMKHKEERVHPTQKPVTLYEWIYKQYASEGNLILDTHLGSGSSRIAAHKAGLSFVGFEIDADYYAAQEKRFKTFTSQLRMF
jgi:site-specific DNA-methyltransferase (adenine-specific)